MSDVSDRLSALMSRERKQVTLPPAANLEPPPAEEKRVSVAIVRYCNAAADEIEKDVARVNERVAKFTQDAHKTAANLRELGQAQCDHIVAMSATVKNAVEAVRDIHTSLLNYMQAPVRPPITRTDTVDAVAKELNGGTES